MKRLSIALALCCVCFPLFAQNDVFVVVGGPVEVFDNETSSWVRKARGSEVRDNDYVRSSASFSLRGKRGLSEIYSSCDSTMVASLKPQKKIEVTRRSNDVTSRELFDAGFLLAPARLQVKRGEPWKFDIVKTAEDSLEFSYEVSSFPEWLIIDNPSGVLSDRIAVTGRVDEQKSASFISFGASCTIVCNGNSLDLPVICIE